MSEKKNDKVSIANILLLVGLAGIGMLTFFGKLLSSSDGKVGMPLILAVITVFILGFLAFTAIRAKKADDNADKWKYVEIAALAFYVLAAILLANPSLHFMHIVSEKEALQEQALSEVAQLDSICLRYDKKRISAIDQAKAELKNYINSPQTKKGDDALSKFIQTIGTTEEAVDSMASKAKKTITPYDSSSIKELEDRCKAWNYMDIPSLALDLKRIEADLIPSIQEYVSYYGQRSSMIPVVSKEHGVYRLDGLAEFDLGEPVQGSFSQMLSKGGSSFLGWVVYIVLNLLVLLNYLVSSRTQIVGPARSKTGDTTHGTIL